MKSRLKSFAASLALAAVSGQAGAAIKSGDYDKLFLTVVSLGGAVAETRDLVTTRESSLPEKAALSAAQLDLTDASGFSLIRTEAFAPNGNHAYDLNLNGRVPFDRNKSARVSPGLHLVASDTGVSGGPVVAIRLAQSKGSVAANFHHAANGQSPAMTIPPVPEPDNWAMLLAGLLGVGAIARRRMSS